MNHLDILLPFGLPPPEMAPDLIRELKTPTLALLLARAASTEQQATDGFSRALPHEQWLARRFGFADQQDDNSPPLAGAAMRALGLQADSGYWFLLQPVHLHIARDHLVLTAPRHLALAETDARALFDTARPLFEEAGHTLLYGDAHTWFVRADVWRQLHTATPDAASGHNIDIWMPKGPTERDWRRLQNEIQMHWHTHPVNDAREAQGLKPVNSVWLWGGADAATTPPPQPARLFTSTGEAAPMPGLAQANPVSSVAGLADGQAGMLLLSGLAEPAMAGAWSEWLGQLQHIEAHWLAPLAARLQDGQLQSLGLVLSHNTGLASFSAGKRSLRKFWIRASLARLLP